MHEDKVLKGRKREREREGLKYKRHYLKLLSEFIMKIYNFFSCSSTLLTKNSSLTSDDRLLLCPLQNNSKCYPGVV
jgi:hypothetical protein